MKFVRLTLIATALTVLPGISMAMCSGDYHQQASSCKEGTTYNSETGTCVPATTS